MWLQKIHSWNVYFWLIDSEELIYFEESSTRKRSVAHSPVRQQQWRATVNRKDQIVLSNINISEETKTNGTDNNTGDDTDENSSTARVWLITTSLVVGCCHNALDCYVFKATML